MLTETRIRMVCAGVLACLLFVCPQARAAGEPQLGRVLYSQGTNLRGTPVPGSGTILNGDVLMTLENGNALVELKSGTRMQIAKNSSVRFLGDGGTIQAELLSGTVVSESAGKSTTVVNTPNYQFAPAQAGECRYVVQLSGDQSTIAGAMEGNLLIQARNATGNYVLRQGNYAAIPASAVGVPGQAPPAVRPVGAQLAGPVANIIPEGVVQPNGQGAEIALKVNDEIYWGDVTRTLQNGRLRVALQDGSALNIGARSTVRFFRHDPSLQQTQIELTAGEMRAWVVKLVQEYAGFKVQTLTAVISVIGTDFIVEAQTNKTGVYCREGIVSVQNIDPDIAGQVTLHAGEYTLVATGQPPSAAVLTPDSVLQTQIAATNVGSAAGPAGAQTTAAKAPWHIGSLSPGASMGVIAGVAGGVVAAGIAAASGHGGSSSSPSPASPSAP